MGLNGIENINFDLKGEKFKNPEEEISKIENNDIPEQKYINICENIGKNSEFIKKICEKIDINLKKGLEENGINLQALFEKNNLDIQNLV